jgi:hypothetical protein
VECGPVYARYRISGETPILRYAKAVTVYAHVPWIEVEDAIEIIGAPYVGHHTVGTEKTQSPGGGWHEAGWHTDCFIEEEKLRTVLSLGFAGGKVARNVVYVPCRTGRTAFSAYDWADVSDETRGVALINSGNPRYYYDREAAELSLILGYSGRFIYSTAPDYHLMRGDYCFRYAIAPHGAYDPAWNNRRAQEANNPMLVMRSYRWRARPGRGPRGWLSQEGALVHVDAPSGIVSTVTLEAGQPAIRLYEDAGTTSAVNICLAWPISGAHATDLEGNVVETLDVQDSTVSLELGPFRIVTIRFELDGCRPRAS